MLLQRLIQIENRDIYNIRQELSLQAKANMVTLAGIQELILDSLISSKKTLIDDSEFISLLGENQQKRTQLRLNEGESRAKNIVIKRIEDNYEDVVEKSSQLFISLKAMSKVSPLLSWNTELFLQYF